MNLRFPAAKQQAFTLMEMLVVVAILLVLAAIAFPVYFAVKSRGDQATALTNMRNLGGALATYVGQNDGTFPAEDSKGIDSWASAAKPENRGVWYNALPKILGYKAVGDYGNNAREFYTKRNILFLPGATYPEADTKLTAPLFAIAINTKLERKDPSTKEKLPIKLSAVTSPTKTVAFLEQGLPKEKKAMAQQPKYDGSCKGSAKSFVARYGGKGVLTFVDGHADTFEGKDILTETGGFPFPQINVVWTKTPEEDPNK